MITLMGDNKEYKVEWVEFSDGALTCKVDPSIKEVSRYLSVCVCPSTPVKQVEEEIELLNSALVRIFGEAYKPPSKRILNLPYLPYGRADRVFEDGNPNPLENFQHFLHEKDFDEVIVCDPHNPKVLDIENINYKIKDQLSCFKESVNPKPSWDYVIAPDKGAKEKARSISKYLGIPLVEAEKTRDTSTGRIIDTKLDTGMPVGSRVIIVDDIGDYCGTHIALAKILKEMGCTVDLYVTHLIAPKGLKALEGVINKVYAYHTVGGYINKSTVLNFNFGK